MALATEVLECPNCGATISNNERICSYCQSPIIVKRIQDVNSMNAQALNRYVQFYQNFIRTQRGETPETLTALGICLLQRNSYKESVNALERAINLLPNDGESRYYLALAMMQKKRPFLHTMTDIKNIVQYLKSALTYGTNGKYYYLLYLIQKDFYEKKRLRSGNNSEDLLNLATENEVDDQEIAECKEYCGLQ